MKKALTIILTIILLPLIAVHFTMWYLFNAFLNGTFDRSKWTTNFKLP